MEKAFLADAFPRQGRPVRPSDDACSHLVDQYPFFIVFAENINFSLYEFGPALQFFVFPFIVLFAVDVSGEQQELRSECRVPTSNA